MPAGCGAVKVARHKRLATLCEFSDPFSAHCPYRGHSSPKRPRARTLRCCILIANSLSCLYMTAWHVAGFRNRYTFAASDLMRSSLFVLAALTALSVPTPASAQRVIADIRIQDGPVAGHIIIGHPTYAHPRYDYSPRYRVVTVYRSHRRAEWYRQHGFRKVSFWYDGGRDRYYDHAAGSRGLREVVVYERGGRYYREEWRDDDRRSRNDRDWREHGERE
jgi:hypothetical protein